MFDEKNIDDDVTELIMFADLLMFTTNQKYL